MGKRSNFKRRKQDAYDTPYKAVYPLSPHLPRASTYIEPCAGAGLLLAALGSEGFPCVYATDINPRAENVRQGDALKFHYKQKADYIITNPPWTRQLLHPMIDHFKQFHDTWLLFDADWAHTKQAIPYLIYCHKIVSVGRVSWMENGVSGLDNVAWYLFKKHPALGTVFVGRR